MYGFSKRSKLWTDAHLLCSSALLKKSWLPQKVLFSHHMSDDLLPWKAFNWARVKGLSSFFLYIYSSIRSTLFLVAKSRFIFAFRSSDQRMINNGKSFSLKKYFKLQYLTRMSRDIRKATQYQAYPLVFLLPNACIFPADHFHSSPPTPVTHVVQPKTTSNCP